MFATHGMQAIGSGPRCPLGLKPGELARHAPCTGSSKHALTIWSALIETNSTAASVAESNIDWFDTIEPANLARHPLGRYRGYFSEPEWSSPALPSTSLEINVLVGQPDDKCPPNTLHVMASVVGLDADGEQGDAMLVLSGALFWWRPLRDLGRRRWMLVFDHAQHSLELRQDPAVVHRLAMAARDILGQLVQARPGRMGLGFEDGVFDSPWEWGMVRHCLLQELGYEGDLCPCCSSSTYFLREPVSATLAT